MVRRLKRAVGGSAVAPAASVPAIEWMAVTSSDGLVIQRWQDRRQPLGQHGLARPGRPEEREVVPAGRGQFQREPAPPWPTTSARSGPSSRRRLSRSPRKSTMDGTSGSWPNPRATSITCRSVSAGRTRTPGTSAASAALAQGHDQPVQAGLGGGQHHRQYSAHRSDPSVQPELADERGRLQTAVGQQAGRGQQHRGDGQVEAGATFGQVGGRRFTVIRRCGQASPELTTAALTRSRASLSDASGRPRQHQRGQAGRDVRLDRDRMAGQPDQADGPGPRVAHGRPG